MYYASNSYLTISEMQVNAQYIMDKLLSLGWTRNSICGMLGNLQVESTINPAIWQNLDYGNMTGGYGLTQWTPATKVTDWLTANGYSWTGLDGEIQRIHYEMSNELQWVNLGLSFEEFHVSTDTPYNLAMIFLNSYERPADPNQPVRGQNADYWNSVLTGGLTPVNKTKKLPIWFYGKIF